MKFNVECNYQTMNRKKVVTKHRMKTAIFAPDAPMAVEAAMVLIAITKADGIIINCQISAVLTIGE